MPEARVYAQWWKFGEVWNLVYLMEVCDDCRAGKAPWRCAHGA